MRQLKRALSRRLLAIMTAGSVLVAVTGCGYFLYPERVGQTDGRVDPTVIILDGAALFFGIVPGVVAFAVDITTGAIYLPPGAESSVEKHTDRLSQNFEGVELTPVTAKAVPLETTLLAAQLSSQLDQTVEAQDIQFYRASDPASTVAATHLAKER